MAIRQREPVRAMQNRPAPLKPWLRRYKYPLIISACLILVVVLTAVIMDGIKRNADLKASELLARAKTVDDFRSILTQFPKSYLTFDVLMNLGNLLHSEGKFQEATKHYEEAFKRYPKGFEGAASACSLGMLSAEQKNYPEANEYFQKAIAADPRGIKVPEVLYQWGKVLGFAGQKEAAREKMGQLIRDFPGSAWATEVAGQPNRLGEDKENK